jgi:hypothetical protein
MRDKQYCGKHDGTRCPDVNSIRCDEDDMYHYCTGYTMRAIPQLETQVKELKERLEIAVDALKHYADKKTWMQEDPYVYDPENNDSYGFVLAQQTLDRILK